MDNRFRALIALVLTALIPIFANSPEIAQAKSQKLGLRLAAGLSANGTTATFTLTPRGDLSSCPITLYAADSSNSLKRHIQSATVVATLSGLSSAVTLQASNLPAIFSAKRHPRKQKVNLRAVANCTTKQVSSNKETVRISASALGTATTVTAWIAQLAASIQSGSNPTPTPSPNPTPSAQIVRVLPNLTFNAPVDLQNCGDSRLFVVEQPGRILSFTNTPGVTPTVFLDIRSKVKYGGEQGLLSMAFHPNFQQNGVFFVHYSEKTNGNTTIARYRLLQSDPTVADPASEEILLSAVQPFANHNGGQIAFGPDGYLYIGLGDGGSGGDPLGNGQKRTTLLGKILRIDVDHTQGALAYAIPPTNPFAGNSSGFKEEIYAYGLRNPWKSSFDSATGDYWVADVGQNAHEEVDLVTKGSNYGWNTMEGDFCYNASTCDQTGLTLPVIDYSHDFGQSITGGYVYRGTANPSLVGRYFYGDFISGKIWSLKMTGGSADSTLMFRTSYMVSTFGVDNNKELYFFDYASGALFTFAP